MKTIRALTATDRPDRTAACRCFVRSHPGNLWHGIPELRCEFPSAPARIPSSLPASPRGSSLTRGHQAAVGYDSAHRYARRYVGSQPGGAGTCQRPGSGLTGDIAHLRGSIPHWAKGHAEMTLLLPLPSAGSGALIPVFPRAPSAEAIGCREPYRSRVRAPISPTS